MPVPQLQAAATDHAAQMAATGVLDHTGPDGSTPRSRLAAHGLQARIVAENIAWNFPDPRAVVDAWLASPPHRQNLLDCRLTGIGVAAAQGPTGTYWSQDFAG